MRQNFSAREYISPRTNSTISPIVSFSKFWERTKPEFRERKGERYSLAPGFGTFTWWFQIFPADKLVEEAIKTGEKISEQSPLIVQMVKVRGWRSTDNFAS